MAESNEGLVQFLKKKTASLKQQIKIIECKFQADDLEVIDEASLTVYLEQVERLYSDFNGMQFRLEQNDDAEIESSTAQEESSSYMAIKTTLTRKLLALRSGVRQASIMRQFSFEDFQGTFVAPPQKPRLPVLQIPKFGGAYTEWPDFYSMFETVVENDADLSKIEKFQHLKSSLTDTALDTIRSLEISGANNDKAIDLLIKRFNNKRLNFQAHIRDIVGIPDVEAGSVVKLRQLTDSVNSHLRALLTMGTKDQIADCLLINIISRKLDIATQTRWEEAASINEIPKWESMATFLQERCQKMENVENALVIRTPGKQVGNKLYQHLNNSKKSFMLATKSPALCSICEAESHAIYTCKKFLSFSPHVRYKEAKRLQLCLNCLRKGHTMKNCKSIGCRECSLKHHTLLHLNSFSPNSTALLAPPTSEVQPAATVSSTSASAVNSPSVLLSSNQHCSSKFVFLATVIVMVKNNVGSLIPCRAILDSGSQAHFVTKRFANELQLKSQKSNTSISGIGQSDFVADRIVDIWFQARVGSFSTMLSAVVIPSIVENQPSSNATFDIPRNIQLADPFFNKTQRIDMLIGADLFYELMCVGQIRLGPELPLLQKTKLGWIVAGGSNPYKHKYSSFVATKDLLKEESDCNLENLVKSFWEIENHIDISSRSTKEEIDCQKHFVENYIRLESGAYSIRLPLKVHPDVLGDSYQQALRRFINLEKRLQHNSELKAQYSSFLQEYLDLKHMSLIDDIPDGVPTYFLPHHCVIKEESSTTKLRVVFDGSARASSGYSLNNILMVGPTIQPTLFDILLRFRSFYIALTGDICKMYRCIKVSPPDNYLQCILWREHPTHPIQTFKLDTVTYGTKSASFLAVRAMHQLANDEGEYFPIGAKIVYRDFYVDDLISGGESFDEVSEILKQTTELLGKGQFVLRKWCSNDPAILRNIPEADKEQLLKFDDGSDVTKTLGLAWEPGSDNFLFSFRPFSYGKRITKRSVLSAIARIYDPLGLIGPVIVKAKVFLQLLWKEKITWDESLSQMLESTWFQMCSEFEFADRCVFPRRVLLPNAHIEVHAFCDASLEAYGSCIYIRSERNSVVETYLLCSKSRVAPLKTITVPKLELSAALLLAELAHSIRKLNIFKGDFHCWSDSNVVLSWLRDESSNYNVFVSNRISRIQTLTSDMAWHHVPTKMNPADILSRGATPKELAASTLWAHGPTFLLKGKQFWPNLSASDVDCPEKRKHVLLVATKCLDLSLECKYITSFGKMQRIFAYISKFGMSKGSDRIGSITAKDVQMGTHLLIRMIQKIKFSSEYRLLVDKKLVDSSSQIKSLDPFLDTFGLLRVGGRLQNSILDFNSRHPIIMPKHHPLTDSIITYFHHKCLHAGPQSLLATIRLQYWPVGGKKTVSRVINKCIRCYRVKPKLVEHIMGSLPQDRVQGHRAFLVVGIDYCGPLYYRTEIRNRAPIKSYVSLFICFATKAVHLELVNDLSTSSFLAALKRFISTRGKPKTIWFDNATNFVGGKNELRELKVLFLSQSHLKAVHGQCLEDGIDWKFIPPRSPHFGGLWEASIKIAKLHLHRTIGLSVLSFDELRTLICQISAIMNSRPLCPISENVEDLDVLTPAHFLVGAPFTSVVEPDVSMLNIHRLGKWQRVCYMQQIFWKKWSTEYLTLLQQRTKWHTSSRNITVGALVLLKDENLPPLKWQLGRVMEVIQGSDGVVRVVILRTNNGITRRAVTKLCILPSETDVVESVNLPTGGGC